MASSLAAMEPAVVAPLLTEKIAEAKRKKGAARLIFAQVLGLRQRKMYQEQRRAAMVQQHEGAAAARRP